MFYSLDNFSFLKPLIDNTGTLLEEYNNYKDIIRSNKQYEQLNNHLSNLENYNLFTSFVMCVYSKHKIGTGQVTNGLFNFNYFMPDRNFLSMKSFFEKKFPDLYYNIDSNENKKYFTNTLKYLDSIPNLTQSGYAEYKNNCIFEPHVHENNIMIFHVLLNPVPENKMLISCNGVNRELNNKNDFILFRGGDLHSAKIISKSNVITFGLSFTSNV
jgi:hypothetical protein